MFFRVGLLVALIALVGGGVWFFNRTPAAAPPPPAVPLPACDDAQQTKALVGLLARPETPLIHETREANIEASMSLKDIIGDDEADAQAGSRLCAATLVIAPRGALPENVYGVTYEFVRAADGAIQPAPAIIEVRPSQLPPCDAPDLFNLMGRITLDIKAPDDVVLSDITEVSFDASEPRRVCRGSIRPANDASKTAPFEGEVSWGGGSPRRLLLTLRLL